ncbi:hypothetical protein SESBI_19259 [Sesbania bispinosa]|nr:hypothetical protein SESBI_19259 [Sesbania bispinosa]
MPTTASSAIHVQINFPNHRRRTGSACRAPSPPPLGFSRSRTITHHRLEPDWCSTFPPPSSDKIRFPSSHHREIRFANTASLCELATTGRWAYHGSASLAATLSL